MDIKVYSFGAKVDRIYRKIGDKGTILGIFIAGFIVHTFFALKMDMMSIDPNEFGVAAWSALYIGKDWSGLMSNIGYFYGYLGALIYSPIMFFVKDPFLQYRVILILNGLVVSFVPVLAFLTSKMLRVEKAWQCTLVAVVCGLYSTTFAHTKFMWNEIFCIIFPWILIYFLLKSDKANNRTKKHFYSVIAAFTIIAAYAAHPRLLSIGVSAVFLILFARIVMKKKVVFISSFLPSLAFFGVLQYFLKTYLITVMWKSSDVFLQNTFSSMYASISETAGAGRFFTTLIGHLYYFATSTWGIGGLGICLVFLLVGKYISERKKQTAKKYNSEIVLFAVYAFISNLSAMVVSSLSKFNNAGYLQYQDSSIFGRYMDSLIPLMIMLVISYTFIYSLDLTKLLWAIVTLGVIYTLFFIYTAPLITAAPQTRVSPILGLYPIRIGENVDSVITLDGLILTVSSVFCFIALFIVIVCCASRYRAHIISLSMVTVMIYSSFYTAIVYLPFAKADTEKLNSPVYEISEYVFNSGDSPVVYTYDVPRRTATLLQYLNQETKIFLVSGMSEIPEHSFIIVRNENRLALRPDSGNLLIELGTTDLYTIYAFGERAIAYAQSQRPDEQIEFPEPIEPTTPRKESP